MDSLNDFLIQKPRPLPVIVAVDRSGSMGTNGKIDALNIALKDFINSIKDEDSNKAEIHISLFKCFKLHYNEMVQNFEKC